MILINTMTLYFKHITYADDFPARIIISCTIYLLFQATIVLRNMSSMFDEAYLMSKVV